MQYRIHTDGRFDIQGEQISLLGCYPAINACPACPVRIEAAQTGVTYFLPDAVIRLSLQIDNFGRAVLHCAAQGLAGVHDIEPVGCAAISGATGIFVQGMGMEGPSGTFRISDDAPKSYGITALYQNSGAFLVYAEDHRRYTTVFWTDRGTTMIGERTFFSAGFNLEGTAGETVELPALYFDEDRSLSSGLRNSAEHIAGRMEARHLMPPAFFWNSWYHAYETMDQALLEETLSGMKRENVPFRYVEIDAGYTPSLGDWLLSNHRWPGGLRQAAKSIIDAGYQAGIWIGPFIVGDQSALYREHPDWVLKDLDGKPVIQLRSYTEPKIWGNRDCDYYVLDASHPDALAYLETVFRTLRSWGFSFFKTDFMFWNMHDTSTVRRYNSGLTSVEILRNVLKVIRDAIGEESYLLGCIAPFMPFIGYADGMRIAGDGGARWAEPYGPINLLRELPCDNYFNHVFWQNDPDAMLLRDFHTFLTTEEARSLALLQAVSGGAVNTSDPVHLLSEERKELLRFIAPDGMHTPELPFFATDRRELIMLHRLEQGNLLFILNPTDAPLTVAFQISALLGGGGWYQSRLDWSSKEITSGQTDIFYDTLPPHASVLLFVTQHPLTSRPKNLWNW